MPAIGSFGIQGDMFPNYFGNLTELNPQTYPLTSLISNTREVNDFIFQSTFRTHPSATIDAKPDDSTPTMGSLGMTLGTNTVSIFDQGAAQTYANASQNRLGAVYRNFSPEQRYKDIAEQMGYALERIRGDYESRSWNGTFLNSGSTFMSRGVRYAPNINNLAADGAVAGSGTLGTNGTLSYIKVMDAMQTLWSATPFKGSPITIFTNATGKRAISEIFRTTFNGGQTGEKFTEAGVDLKMFDTDFGPARIVLSDMIEANTMYFLNLDVMSRVSCPVPGKGNLFEEELSAGDNAHWRRRIYGQMGIDHGYGGCHLRLYGVGSTVKGGVAVSAT